jgi:hypothetical protein
MHQTMGPGGLVRSDRTDNPMEVSLSYLSKIIGEIHQNLIQLEKKVSYHHTKYFSTWRTLNVVPILTELEINTQILKGRFDDFIKICGIYGK